MCRLCLQARCCQMTYSRSSRLRGRGGGSRAREEFLASLTWCEEWYTWYCTFEAFSRTSARDVTDCPYALAAEGVVWRGSGTGGAGTGWWRCAKHPVHVACGPPSLSLTSSTHTIPGPIREYVHIGRLSCHSDLRCCILLLKERQLKILLATPGPNSTLEFNHGPSLASDLTKTKPWEEAAAMSMDPTNCEADHFSCSVTVCSRSGGYHRRTTD